jgi:hypothetical protein
VRSSWGTARSETGVAAILRASSAWSRRNARYPGSVSSSISFQRFANTAMFPVASGVRTLTVACASSRARAIASGSGRVAPQPAQR